MSHSQVFPSPGHQAVIKFCEEASIAHGSNGKYDMAVHISHIIPGFLQPTPLTREIYRADTPPMLSMNDFIEGRHYVTERIELALGRGTLRVRVAVLEALLWRNAKHLHLIRRRILGMLDHFPGLDVRIIPNNAGWYKGNEVSWYYMCTPQGHKQLSVGQTDVLSLNRYDLAYTQSNAVQKYYAAFEHIWGVCADREVSRAMIERLPKD